MVDSSVRLDGGYSITDPDLINPSILSSAQSNFVQQPDGIRCQAGGLVIDKGLDGSTTQATTRSMALTGTEISTPTRPDQSLAVTMASPGHTQTQRVDAGGNNWGTNTIMSQVETSVLASVPFAFLTLLLVTRLIWTKYLRRRRKVSRTSEIEGQEVVRVQHSEMEDRTRNLEIQSQPLNEIEAQSQPQELGGKAVQELEAELVAKELDP
ncbi:hypothetical protein MMC10_008854 [Thelotrema lepadinum]|nr:hypothetical protein [Thelotrema lepadinum]